MAKVFITGSADGLGSLVAQQLIKDGHSVVLHARNDDRAEAARQQAPGADTVLIGDLSDTAQIKDLAKQANALGEFDAVIHNAGIYSGNPGQLFTVNSLAPYMLTCLISKPKRLIYLSSGAHKSGRTELNDLEHTSSYGDSKLQLIWLAKAVARKWPDVYANAVDPGWVPTKMGGPGAPDDLTEGYMTQVWLATSNDDEAKVSGQYFYHRQPAELITSADDTKLQDEFIARCAQISGCDL